jgi:hypothetical protein
MFIPPTLVLRLILNKNKKKTVQLPDEERQYRNQKTRILFGFKTKRHPLRKNITNFLNKKLWKLQ